jgi:hypothetical protein
MILRHNEPPAIIWELKGGLSPESRTIQNLLNAAREHARQPISRSWQTFLKDNVREVSKRYAHEGWDGYDASPISTASTVAALKLIDQLPENLQEPQVVPEPDGEIALEWRSGKDTLFSLTVSGPTLSYAGIMGSKRRYGQERFFNELPQIILDTLSSYFRKV